MALASSVSTANWQASRERAIYNIHHTLFARLVQTLLTSPACLSSHILTGYCTRSILRAKCGAHSLQGRFHNHTE